MLKDFAERHGNFFVIFSSVHEALLVPSEDDSSLDEITLMNLEVNEQLLAEEILGTRAYYYEKGKGFCTNKNL